MTEIVSATEVLDAGEVADFLNLLMERYGDDDAGVMKAILMCGIAKATLETALEIEPVEVFHEA